MSSSPMSKSRVRTTRSPKCIRSWTASLPRSTSFCEIPRPLRTSSVRGETASARDSCTRSSCRSTTRTVAPVRVEAGRRARAPWGQRRRPGRPAAHRTQQRRSFRGQTPPTTIPRSRAHAREDERVRRRDSHRHAHRSPTVSLCRVAATRAAVTSFFNPRFARRRARRYRQGARQAGATDGRVPRSTGNRRRDRA